MEEDLITRAKHVLTKLNLDGKRKTVRELEAESTHPDFWKDSAAAAKKMKQMAALQKEVEDGEMLDLLIEDGNAKELEKAVDHFEFALYLSGPYDRNDAIFAIHAGQGGTEAMDWTSMLYRMYSRYVERKGWEAEEIDFTPGDEAGIKSITISVTGSYAYGFLKAEAGVHRLVRQSPFNADKLRQTSFAMVEVWPVFEEGAAIDIKEEDVEWEFYRSGGKGGQNVNKVSSAIRITHLPTGIVVQSQSDRSQQANRETAMKVLKAKLYEMLLNERKEKIEELKGEHKAIEWGSQIRSYVFQPYTLVKDHRTGVEVGDVQKVIDGYLDPFIDAILRKEKK